MQDARRMDLQEKETEIRTILDMTDEEEDQDAMRELMERLKIIQDEIKSLQ